MSLLQIRNLHVRVEETEILRGVDLEVELTTTGRFSIFSRSMPLPEKIWTQRVEAKVAPGKTREINFYEVNDSFYLVDLPGYGYARAPEEMRQKWPAIIDVFLSGNPMLEGVILLMDSRRGVLPADRRLLSFLPSNNTEDAPRRDTDEVLSGFHDEPWVRG